ncbi:DUF975 family protein [Romboutsia sedimentorum]|uniref:DUF975 family protein n=1 Tax=Romboutsia sedimentorum TaxID=1368474 RepID=A0ABT7E6B0_9FIRM|nr:DUF975 family protein [Romboutsia sedimentorum]MDK2562422.1 DUF975 family protein [Romboutsia sedimentorum]
MDRKGLKNLSKQQLKGHWKVPVLITLIYCALIFPFEFIPSDSTFFMLISLAVILCLEVWACVGLPKFYLEFIKKSSEATYSDLKVSKSAILKSLGFTVIVSIVGAIAGGIISFILIGSIGVALFSSASISGLTWGAIIVVALISVALVVFNLAVGLAPYIFVDKEELKLFESIGLSIKMMKGNKWKFFVLQLSFIGWGLLATVTVIGLLWFIPYMQMTVTNFYKSLDYSKDIA